jgi:glycosyltransferase involved in cell wall biosynthesis
MLFVISYSKKDFMKNDDVLIINLPGRLSGAFKVAYNEHLIFLNNYRGKLNSIFLTSCIHPSNYDIVNTLRLFGDINAFKRLFFMKRSNLLMEDFISKTFKLNRVLVQDILNMPFYRNALKKLLERANVKYIIGHTSASLIILPNNIFVKGISLYPYIHSYLLGDYTASYVSRYLSGVFFKMEDRYLEAADVIIANTFRTKKYLESKGIEAKRIAVLYPGAYSIERLPAKNRKNIIVSLTRWDIDRKIEFYLKLSELLKQEKMNYKLALVGEWPKREILMETLKRIKRKGLSEYIYIVGSANETQLYKILARARMYLFAENAVFGMGALEAAAQGTPIVVSWGSGIWEIFQHKVHGYRAKTGDIWDFFKGIMFVDAKWDELSQAIYKEAQKFDWNNHAKGLLKIIGFE